MVPRRRHLRTLALLAAAVAAALVACQERGASDAAVGAGAAASTRATVSRVVDGDTLLVRLADGRRVRVRLIGIDTPEVVKPGAKVQCGGPQASAAMRRLVLRGDRPRAHGRAVVLVGDPSQDAEDRFGRRLAYVEAVDDAGARRDVGRALVRAGWARARAYDGRYRRQDAYEAEERAAQRADAGIWGLC